MRLFYDGTVYPHHAHLPFAHEPLKSIYVLQRIVTTLALVPYWILKYTILPTRYRPRPSWSIVQIVHVNFVRRIYKITEVAGVTWGTRDPQSTPEPGSLKHTRFQWINPIPERFRTGIVRDKVPFLRVGAYIYPKEAPSHNTVLAGKTFVIGIFMHGGGYCHMSAHESSRSSRIPKRLIKDRIFDEIYAVEYRLLQHARFPAAVQDAAAVYLHVVEAYRELSYKIVLIGDSSGGNLVLALTRWLRDEVTLPTPHALLLLSPSCDPSHALPETLSSYIPRPNGHIDYLTDTPEPRALLHRTFLGFQHRPGHLSPEDLKRMTDIVHSEYVSPCSPIVLERWGHEIKQDNEGMYRRQFRRIRDNNPPSLTALPTPNINRTDGGVWESGNFPALFYGFPRTLVVVGDAERLTREISSLIQAMDKDGVDVEAFWAPDAVHDVLMMSDWIWDRQVLNQCWDTISHWVRGI